MAELTSASPGVTPQRVALVFADANAAIETAWSLLAAGHEVLAVERRGRKAPLSRSRRVVTVAVADPEADLARCVEDLTGLVARERVDHLMLMDDIAVALGESASFGCGIIGPTGELARLALDKSLQVRLAEDAGFDVPRTSVVTDRQQLNSVALPAIIKPVDAAHRRDGRLASSRAYYCADEKERSAAGDDMGARPYLAQEIIRGRGVGIFGIVTSRGVEHLSGHRRLRMMNPAGSGSSACEPLGVPAGIIPVVERFLECAAWRGLFMVELLQDADGKFWFVELNGRPWGSMALARDVGLEYPSWAVTSATDPAQALVRRPPAGPVRLTRHLGREMVHAAFVFRGPRTRAPINWPSRSRTVLDLLRFVRGTRWYNWCPGEMRVFLSDVVATLVQQLRR